MKHYDCPKCRTSIDMVSMKLPRKRGFPSPKKTRLRAVKVFFESDVKSDPASQIYEEGDLEDEIEDSEEEDIFGPIEGKESGPRSWASPNEELVELRKQHREMRETLRTVKGQRDGLISTRKELDALEDHSADLLEDLIQAKHDLATVRAEVVDWKAGQPDLQVELYELQEQLDESEEIREELQITADAYVGTSELKDQQYEKMNTTWVQKEDEWRAEKLRLEIERKKLLERINSEGSAGAGRIKELKAAANAQEARILEYELLPSIFYLFSY